MLKDRYAKNDPQETSSSVTSSTFCSSDGHTAEQQPGRAAGGEGGVAAEAWRAGFRAVLSQTAAPAPAELPGAGEADEQHGAGEPACPAPATGADSVS